MEIHHYVLKNRVTKRDSDGNMFYYFPYLLLDMRYHISFED